MSRRAHLPAEHNHPGCLLGKDKCGRELETLLYPKEKGSRGIIATQYPLAKINLPKSEKELLTSQMLN